MTVIPVPLGPASDSAKSTQGGGALLTNCYVEKTEGGKTAFSVNTLPRLKSFSTVSSGNPGRGALSVGNKLYVVCGEYAYRIDSVGAATNLGVVLGQKPVTMSVNRKASGEQITITADTKNYYIEADVLTEVTDTDLPSGVHSNCYINGRTVYGLNDGVFYISDEEETASVDALNFAEAERSSDMGIRVYTYGEDFWYFGAQSREIFRYTGEEFPFAPLLGAGQGEGDGCAAKNSVATVGKVVMWVNDLKTVVASTGGAAERVSTHEVDRDITRAIVLGYADEITGYSFSIEGHDFYYLRCPLWCWVFDSTYGFWYGRTSYGLDAFRGGFAVRAFSKDLLLDATDGVLYEHTFEVEDDAGEPCISKIKTSPLNAFPDGYVCDCLEVDVQSGVGIASGAAHEQEPALLLRVSKDGGMTYGNIYSRSLGAQGNYSALVRYNRLGSTRGKGMVFELSSPEPVQRAIFQATADVRKLT